MELEALKASWNKLDERLAETEIVNLRVVKEVIQQKTKSAYEGIIGQNLYTLVVNILIICVVFPYVYMNTPIRTVSFAIVEGLMVIGLIPMIRKLLLLSKFDLAGKKSYELSRLVLNYKKICHNETLGTIVIVATGFISFYISELGFNPCYKFEVSRVLLVIGLTLITFAIAFGIGLWQIRRHAQQLQEIDRGLEELREFEHPSR